MKKIFFSILLLIPFYAISQIRLPAVISDNMVLEQKSEVALWGWSGPSEKIYIQTSWNNSTDSAVATSGAVWKTIVKTPAAGGPYTVTVSGGGEKIILKNIMIGEVWLCSGQSNMERDELQGELDAKAEGVAANNPDIRFFKIPKTTAAYPQDNLTGSWVQSDTNTLKGFSSVAYFFAKKLQEKLHVPIGLIGSYWGGTNAETWTPASQIDFDPVLKEEAKLFTDNPWWPVIPGLAYNAMIAPLENYNIAGVIWYQGETNAITYPFTYAKLFGTLIRSWRTKWNKDLPFYYVQIAPFTGYKNDWGAVLREQQTACMKIPNTGMVVITDLVDDINNIHPKHKKQVGYRLANRALAQTYGLKNIIYKNPSFDNMKIDKNKISINFKNTEGGLTSDGQPLTEFQIAGADQHFFKAYAIIKGNTVIVSSPEVKDPVAVRFAFSNAPQPHLFGKSRLPVIPFRTDDWKTDTLSNTSLNK